MNNRIVLQVERSGRGKTGDPLLGSDLEVTQTGGGRKGGRKSTDKNSQNSMRSKQNQKVS